MPEYGSNRRRSQRRSRRQSRPWVSCGASASDWTPWVLPESHPCHATYNRLRLLEYGEIYNQQKTLVKEGAPSCATLEVKYKTVL